MENVIYWLSMFVVYSAGVLSGIVVIGLCRAAGRSDLESKIYELRSKLEVERFKQRQYPIEGAD
tara:strand:- start:426 stop:617 length:192 start_codon:yes stop_codon:yes gene_type:complete